MTVSPLPSRQVTFAAAGPLRGTARVPGDKSISHRALLFAALAEGTSQLVGLSNGDDVVRTRLALEALGIPIDGEHVDGGRGRFQEAERAIDMGNSGTGLRLMAGLAAGFRFLTILQGDESIHRRPMGRVVAPLRAMGARVDGRDDGRLAPLVVRGGSLTGIDHTPSVASAQVKAAVLLAGLAAEGTTTVREPIPTRRHSEELLALFGAPVDVVDKPGAYAVRVRCGPLRPVHLDVPADPSQAAFVVVAASVVEGSEVLVERVYLGPGRAGFVDVLRRMGADLEVERIDETTGNIVARHARLHGTVVEGDEVPDCIDEIPVLAVAAALAEGTTTFADAGELRVKESDRVAAVVAGIRAVGGRAEERPDGLVVEGTPGLSPAGVVDAAGDHRVAMAFAVAGLAGGPIAVEGFESVATSWPGFVETLEALV